MVFTRYEKSQYTLATSFDVMEIVDVHQNGAGSFAVVGRRWGENRVNLLLYTCYLMFKNTFQSGFLSIYTFDDIQISWINWSRQDLDQNLIFL